MGDNDDLAESAPLSTIALLGSLRSTLFNLVRPTCPLINVLCIGTVLHSRIRNKKNSNASTDLFILVMAWHKITKAIDFGAAATSEWWSNRGKKAMLLISAILGFGKLLFGYLCHCQV